MMKLPAARGLGRPHVRSLAVIAVTRLTHQILKTTQVSLGRRNPCAV